MTNDDAIKIALKMNLFQISKLIKLSLSIRFPLKFDKKMKHLLKNYENR